MTLPNDPDYIKLDMFFRMIFGVHGEGYVNVAYRSLKTWNEYNFKYPEELPNLVHNVLKYKTTGSAYFCPQLLKTNRIALGQKSTRTKDNVKECGVLWADLDTCSPELMLVRPTITVESSPDRWQAYWILDIAAEPEEAEALCRAIAYHHVPDGADSSGWDLTQLMRIPYTVNFKYLELPIVAIRSSDRSRYDPKDFSEYVESRRNKTRAEASPMPDVLPTEDPLDMLQRYRKSINPIVFSIFSVEPSSTPGDGGWSKILWQLIMLCFEAGMSREEVFVIAAASACNKYKRDGKNPRLLWEEVCRGHETTVEKLNIFVPETVVQQSLISDSELQSIEGIETYVERYISWASSLGDAAKQYHQAAAFMSLSSILSGSIRLPTSFGVIMPNLWFMILADTTLTRKSTAMDVAMELVDEVDPNILLATDGSLEGLLQAMEARPGQPSVFLRDEFSGLLESMVKKDYYAGMAETLTKLYDGKTMKRVLKRETITVREPCLLMFAGGIKNRVQALLTLDHISSGFVPRFLFITAESDVSKLKPLGPPSTQNLEDRTKLVEELTTLRERYVQTQKVLLKGALIGIQTEKHEAYLTEDAWSRYNILESTLLYAGVQSDQPDIMTPVYDRLAKSVLKAAVLLAASRMPETPRIRVEVEDLLIALKYATNWRDYAIEIINGVGRTAGEIELQRIYASIQKHPGIARSRLMQWYHLDARRADVIFGTLEQRGLISSVRMGKTNIYEALGRMKA
jgi:hypothetical protein